eukprot:scaffold3051_cov167-Ochromonas_danica.AAC.30
MQARQGATLVCCRGKVSEFGILGLMKSEPFVFRDFRGDKTRLTSHFPCGLLAARFIPKIPKIALNENPEIRMAGDQKTRKSIGKRIFVPRNSLCTKWTTAGPGLRAATLGMKRA